jgi:hypothetical protein
MPKLTRALVLGAMLAVLSSATAAVAQPPTGASRDPVQEFRAGERASQGQPVSRDEAVQRFRAGERASMTHAAARDQAVQRFRAGERASQAQPASEADGSSLAQQRRWYYESLRVQPPLAPAQPTEPGTPVALLAALAAAAVLARSLDALSIRRKARKAAAHPAI